MDGKEELRGIINAGHTRDTATVVRVEKVTRDTFAPRIFNVFGARVFARIGVFPSTIRDRAVEIKMKRRGKHEKVEPLRIDRLRADTEHFRQRCFRWASDNVEVLRTLDPPVPAQLNDRAADNSRPLLAIADLIGGPWPARARTALSSLCADGDDDLELPVQLLADVRDFFDKNAIGVSFATTIILEYLRQLPESPWGTFSNGGLTPAKFASLLRPFGIRSHQNWKGGKNFHGYRRVDFADAFGRWLPAKKDDAHKDTDIAEADGIGNEL